MHKIIVDKGLNQHDEGIRTKYIFVSDTCRVCLKETSPELACKMCRQKIHTFSGHASKCDEMAILCNICFKTENAIESKINSKINLEIQAK